MPFDAMSDARVSDLLSLRRARDGLTGEKAWTKYGFGQLDQPDAPHCIVGWLLVATDGDDDAAARLAVDYVYPSLPPKAQKKKRMASIWQFNDRTSTTHARIVKLLDDAIARAERGCFDDRPL